MKKYGGFIPGIRPGRPTAEYLDFVLTRITTPGALYLGLVSLIPMVAFALLNATQDFLRWREHPHRRRRRTGYREADRESAQQRNYEGFLR